MGTPLGARAPGEAGKARPEGSQLLPPRALHRRALYWHGDARPAAAPQVRALARRRVEPRPAARADWTSCCSLPGAGLPPRRTELASRAALVQPRRSRRHSRRPRVSRRASREPTRRLHRLSLIRPPRLRPAGDFAGVTSRPAEAAAKLHPDNPYLIKSRRQAAPAAPPSRAGPRAATRPGLTRCAATPARPRRVRTRPATPPTSRPWHTAPAGPLISPRSAPSGGVPPLGSPHASIPARVLTDRAVQELPPSAPRLRGTEPLAVYRGFDSRTRATQTAAAPR